jgi:hypothetical protein
MQEIETKLSQSIKGFIRLKQIESKAMRKEVNIYSVNVRVGIYRDK